MDKNQLIEKLKEDGFSSDILNAFRKVPRENFIPEHLKEEAYEDEALPLEAGATISQPYTVAFMLNLLELRKGLKILEIGSGCGYVLALLSEITNGEIFGVEIISSLAEKSKKNLFGFRNVNVFNRNGINGLAEEAPFDRILISADAGKIPEHLFSQLKDDGILVCPAGDSIFQITKNKDGVKIKKFFGFVFVPLKK